MYYRLPLCVINDPINFNADHLAKKLVDKKAPKEVIFKVISLSYFSFIAKQFLLKLAPLPALNTLCKNVYEL